MIPETFYHIYNRGNNRQKIFFKRDNYVYFLKKIRQHLLPHVHLLAWCLMPNHFHLLVYTKPFFENKKFSNDLRVMLRSYTRAINKQEKRTGSLFQQNTSVKALDSHGITRSDAMTQRMSADYPFICFHYIHQNPVKAGLVAKMEDWEMSSFRDYVSRREGTLCSQELARQLLDLPTLAHELIKQSYSVQIE